MAKVVLPKLNQTGANLWSSVQANDEALQTVLNAEITNENLSGAAGITNANLAGEITRAKLAAESKPVTWYAPKIIATEESRENAAYGTLTTKDEITGVVLPENGLIVVGYVSLVKNSVESAGRVAIFLGANQLKVPAGASPPIVQETALQSTGLNAVATNGAGLNRSANGAQAFVTTGMTVGAENSGNSAGLVAIWAAAGTYAVSIQYKASSGTITSKERRLWVYTLGF